MGQCNFRALVGVSAWLSAGLLLAFQALAQSSPAAKLTVDQAVAEAIQNHPALMAERANIGIADARIVTARLRPNPEVSTAGDHLDLLGTGFNETNGGGPSELSLRTDFPIERGGKRERRIDVAEKSKSVVELALLDAVRVLTLDVRNTYVDALLARENLALARLNLESLNRIVAINAARVKAGDIPEVDLIRSRVAALQYANAVRRAELAVQEAATRLKTVLGRSSVSPAPEVSGDLGREPAALALDELRAAALDSRPDLRAMRLDQERAAAELRLQLAQAKPDFTVGAEYRRQQVNAQSNSLGVFVSAPLQIFNRNQGEIARARQEQRQGGLRLRALELAVAGEVESAYNRFLAAQGLLQAIRGQLMEGATDVRKITDYSYQRGEATLLQLLDAQRTFNDTMQDYNEARAEYARSLYLLDGVCGKAVTR
jgi:cobalt-zinc-cadmium efflux system outer membrane protein